MTPSHNVLLHLKQKAHAQRVGGWSVFTRVEVAEIAPFLPFFSCYCELALRGEKDEKIRNEEEEEAAVSFGVNACVLYAHSLWLIILPLFCRCT